MTSKERLAEYLRKKEITFNSFYIRAGLSNGFLSKPGSLGSSNIEKIISICTDLNLEWLITGKGEMIKKEVKPDQKENHKPYDENLFSERFREEAEGYFNVLTKLQQHIEAQNRTIELQNKLIERLSEQLNNIGNK